ncbi:type I restriction enzyme HsdR N-terminal domain-containing protein [Marinifilum sp. D737]|uniref:type I restriction enzyme HsdR N-terminal domain-containing protein n=1 Tax=Marinifilum sp. D737 TaxID=2969628 RepID=UPI00227320CE|nr:type I restriction enzyme HsdR N-terminal domain-containing protein [Marinifilum sp. D737]MCY1634401.1 type I restriction enzyme HsdR N-terminal domain-containing protein [Marinifilum sp. D737]
MNEEDIRGRILLPFLYDLGFDNSEIFLEKSFTIRLGKSCHKISGRSDILCKRNGKNLFIIELKNDSITISQKDIDQGISYARLLEDNIAPFTIITNGKITRIFDSITKKELIGSNISEQSTYWQNESTLSTDIDLRIRFEALKNFVSFSPENLKQFCEMQVRDRMGPIIGNIDDPLSKFIKELHIQRQDLQDNFNKFINSDASIFSIVGSAGVGKTSAMCSLALQRLNHDFVFFYNAAIINKSPLEHISQDLNGVFSSKSESSLVLKKLNEFGRFVNKRVLVFIDAIDESVDSNISLELSEIAFAIRNFSKIKICISCKSTIWKNILTINGNCTHLFEELNKFHDLIGSLDNTPGFLLKDFRTDELKGIIPLYQKAFGFKGCISETLLNELRNGFFLRIFSEVYCNKLIPQKIDDKDLIKRYINQSLEKTKIGVTTGLRILSKIGYILINHKYHEWESFKDEGLEVENLLDNLNFSIDEVLPEDLFDRNILIKSNKEDSYNISFYYSKIRDYVICFHSFKLNQLNNEEFYKLLPKFYENHIGQSALSFYMENANITHRDTLVKYKKDKALQYVNGYNSYLDFNFSKIKEKFNPNTKGDIGILLPKDLLEKDGYALFPMNSDSESKIEYENLLNPFSSPYDENRIIQKGVKRVHSSNISIMVYDQDKIINKNIFKQLREIIQKGKLNVYNSDILLKEQVATILYYYYKKLDYNFKLKDFNLPRYVYIYPIDLKELWGRIYKFRAFEYYKRKERDSSTITQKVHEAITTNLNIPKLNITGDFPPFEELYKIVNILLEKGYDVIEKHHLPYPDKSVDEAKEIQAQNYKNSYERIRSVQYSEEQAKLYIREFFKLLEICYKDFVEWCFPKMKDEFLFYNTIPHEYIFYMKNKDVLDLGCFGYRHSNTEKFDVTFREYDKDTHNLAFKVEKLTSLHGFSLDKILHNDYNNRIKAIDGINTPRVDDFCVMRNWIYRILKNDMRKLFKENGENI